MNKNISRICRAVMAAVLVAMISSFSASAYPTSFFASTSKLSTGKWVRVSVDHDGVYQLTATELRQMGFNDINRVKIYGQGGHMLNEVLDGTSTDDLIEQATAVFGDKLCFYGRGPLEVYMDVSTTPVSFKRRVNGYSTVGCYFLTEGDNPKRVPQRTWIAATGGANHSVSYNWMLHERELSSLSLCGKDLLGEDLRTQVVSFPYSLPNLSSPTLGFQMRGVATCSDSAFVSASMTIGGQKVNVPYEDKYRKMPPTPNLTHYSSVSPLVAMTLPSLATTGQININPVTSKKTFDAAQLDYVMVTYQHTNTLAGETDNQTRIYLTEATLGDTITMTGGGNVMLWNVDDDVPAQMAQHIQGNLTLFNIARSTESPTMHVAFDPTLELSHITSYEPVANQNLHGAPTPDMIIVTHLNFLDQANQLADLHRSHDHADVLVVTEQEVFNEFSSGTRDAMAVRLMCKMFYDRDPQKMKYLLLFGQGTYDNRGLSTVKPGSIITFEADESASETAGYAPDDFFGILDDGSGGKNLSSGKVRLGVGRITPAHVHEAQGDVDKIIKYVTQPDYGVWRNNAFIAGQRG